MQGTTRAQLDRLRSEIIQCLAMLEALIDFGEGEDIEEGLYEQGNFCLSKAAWNAQLCNSARASSQSSSNHSKLSLGSPTR
jgi:tRNA U34 5-carboxymethylaminomethyl modifying GTPase MnmE/TrmE